MTEKADESYERTVVETREYWRDGHDTNRYCVKAVKEESVLHPKYGWLVSTDVSFSLGNSRLCNLMFCDVMMHFAAWASENELLSAVDEVATKARKFVLERGL